LSLFDSSGPFSLLKVLSRLLTAEALLPVLTGVKERFRTSVPLPLVYSGVFDINERVSPQEEGLFSSQNSE